MFRSEKLPGFDESCLLAKGISLENVLGPEGSSILYIQPCATDESRVNCEVRFGVPGKGVSENFYDFPTLSRVVSGFGDGFTEVRSSPILGVSRVRWKGKSVLISVNGRVIIREAFNEDDARAAVDFFSKLLSPSIVCVTCGRPLLDCATSSCAGCMGKQTSFAASPTGKTWSNAFLAVRSLITIIEEVRDSIAESVSLGKGFESFEPLSLQCYHTSQRVLECIVDSVNREELTAGLSLLRRAWDLSLILGLLDQTRHKQSVAQGLSINPFLNLLGLWLMALRMSVDGIVDSKSGEMAPQSWAIFHDSWNRLYRDWKGDCLFGGLIDTLAGRWQ